MKLSRKRKRELRKLRGSAQDLLDQQRVVLGNAGDVLQSAGRQAKHLSDEHLAPRVERVTERVRPGLERAADNVRVLTAPIVAGALASTVRTLDRLDNRDASRQVQKFGERAGLLKSQKKGVGGKIALGVGIAAALGVAYALWQAFREDDELWVAPEQ